MLVMKLIKLQIKKMNHADVLPDPNIDDFDAVGELDYGEDEPDVPG